MAQIEALETRRPPGSDELDDLQRKLDTVIDLSQDLAGRFELAPLLHRILDHAASLLNCTSGSISLVDEANGTYTKKADIGVGCQEGHTFSLAEGFTGQIVRSRTTVILGEYSQVKTGHISAADPRWNCAAIGVPIFWADEIIGSCIIFSATPGRIFTESDARLVELFANNAAIAIANSQLHAVATERERDAAIAEERERALHDIHETVGRSLASVLIKLDEAENAILANRAVSPIIANTRTMVHDLALESRRTMLGLGAGSLSGRTLEEAIESELAWVRSMCPTKTQFVEIGERQPIAPEIAHHVFKVTQEALSNVVSHARAASVRVGLVYRDGRLSVIVEDDGRGFDSAAVHGDHSALSSRCLGLHGMAWRASHLGGEFDIETTPGWGTRACSVFPLTERTRIEIPRPQSRILIASDQPIVSAGLVRLLNLNELDISVVAEVTSIAQLRDSFELMRPDMLVVDLEMLHRDSTGTIALIRAMDPHLAIVVLTESPSVEEVRSAARAGVRGYITRRLSADAIVRIIIAAAQGNALLDGDLLEHLTDPSRSVDLDDNLTAREREVREKIGQGLADKQIATVLQISVKTVEKHVGSILRKTGARNRTMLVAMQNEPWSVASPE